MAAQAAFVPALVPAISAAVSAFFRDAAEEFLLRDDLLNGVLDLAALGRPRDLLAPGVDGLETIEGVEGAELTAVTITPA